MNTALDFEFNGVHSSTFGVYKINFESGVMLEESGFLANKTVNTFRLKNSKRSHKTSIMKEPLTISMVLYLNGYVDDEREQIIKRWLETDEFCKLKFESSKYEYNAIVQGEARLFHDAKGDGYIEFEFLTDSPFKFSQEIVLKGQSTSETEYKTINIINDGSEIIEPIVEIIAPETINLIEFKNKTTNKVFKIEGTYTNLTMDILNEFGELHSEGNFKDLYENHNGTFIELVRGRNEIQIKGRFYFTIRYRNVYL